jgi:hypothetical protein
LVFVFNFAIHFSNPIPIQRKKENRNPRKRKIEKRNPRKNINTISYP